VAYNLTDEELKEAQEHIEALCNLLRVPSQIQPELVTRILDLITDSELTSFGYRQIAAENHLAAILKLF